MNKKTMKSIISILLVSMTMLFFAFVPNNKSNAIENKKSIKGEGIQFMEADWNKALAEAKKQNKLIFLDAYASWCGPCKQLKKNTFPDKEAGEYFNNNFINIAIDMEKGDGPALSEKYSITAYPTLIITDARGQMLTFTQGYIKPKQLIEFGKHAVSQTKK